MHFAHKPQKDTVFEFFEAGISAATKP